jgi:DNA polymerase-3 subunit beta
VEGETVIPGRLFAEYAKKIEEEKVELDCTGGKRMKISYLDNSVNINMYDVFEYPTLNEVGKDKSFVILKKDLKDIVNKIIFNVSTDETRPAMRGCCFNIMEDSIEGVASDGFRMALVKAPIKNNGLLQKIVVPAKSLMELVRLLDEEEETVAVFIDKSYFMVDLFHTKIVTRLISEEYIRYEKVFPKEFNTVVTVEKKVMEASIDRVALINKSEKKAYVKLDVREEVLYLSAQSTDGDVYERTPVKTNGKDITIAFNSKYIEDCLKAIDDEFITLNITTSTAAAVIKGETDKWLYLILPLRVVG